MKRYSPLAIVALLLAFVAGPSRAEPPVWVVHGRNATLVLFGSVHLLPAGLDWEPQRLRGALARADDVWFEIPLDAASAQEAGQIALDRGVLPPGETLDSKLPPATRERLAKMAAKEGLPSDKLQHLRPWLADLTLSLAAYGRDGALQQDGVERKLSQQLRAGVRREAFETAREQVELLAGSPLADQVASLDETLKDLEAGDDSYAKVLKAWMAGDAKALEHETLDPLMADAPGVYRSLVVDRNRRWMNAIRRRLDGSGMAVIVVGAGHLVGPESLPALLRADGFQVDGP